MTATRVHSFVLNLYENEVRRIMNQLVDAIVDKFHIDKQQVQDAIEEKLNFELKPAPLKETFSLVRKTPRAKKPPLQKMQCIALTRKKVQCNRYAMLECDKCFSHSQKCKYGTV